MLQRLDAVGADADLGAERAEHLRGHHLVGRVVLGEKHPQAGEVRRRRFCRPPGDRDGDRGGKAQHGFRPSFGPVAQADRAAQAFGQRPHDLQAEPVARPRRGGRAGTGRRLGRGAGQAGAAVHDVEGDGAGRLAPRGQADAARPGELHRIAEQVVDDPLQRERVEREPVRQVALRLDDQIQPALAGRAGMAAAQVVEEAHQVDDRRTALRRRIRRLAEDAADEVRERPGGSGDPVDLLAGVGVQGRRLDLPDRPEQALQRPADVVAEHGQFSSVARRVNRRGPSHVQGRVDDGHDFLVRCGHDSRQGLPDVALRLKPQDRVQRMIQEVCANGKRQSVAATMRRVGPGCWCASATCRSGCRRYHQRNPGSAAAPARRTALRESARATWT